MDFQSKHMYYVLGSPLTFKCIFSNDFILIFFYKKSNMIHDGKKIWIEKNSKKNLTNK